MISLSSIHSANDDHVAVKMSGSDTPAAALRSNFVVVHAAGRDDRLMMLLRHLGS
jgi:hypothetical protein